MNDTAPEQSVGGNVDVAKLVAAVVLVIAGIAGFYILQTQSDWVRWGAVVAGVLLGLAVFVSSARGRAVWLFVLESRLELRKVVWPTRQETTTTTMVVFAFVIVAGFFFWGLDWVLSWITRLLTGQGS